LRKYKDKYPKLVIKLLSKNVGAGGGRNIGWEIAKHEFIVSIDHDARISVADLKQIPSRFRSLPHVGILAFKIVHPITNELQNPHGDKICEIANFHGSGFAIRKAVVLDTLGMDSEVIYGGDELELSIKAHSAGWNILYIPDIIVLHNSRTHDRKEEISRDTGYLYGNVKLLYKFFPNYLATRNSLRYLFIALISAFKKFGISSILVLLVTYFKAMKDGLNNKHTIDFRTIKFYNNSKLRPEFGNVPMTYKLFKSILNNFKK
jgi:GT2 family glycosyltransferase